MTERTTDLRAGRPEAAAAIWSWRPAPPPAPLPTRPIRLRGVLQAAAGLAVAGALLWWGHRLPAAVVASIASAVGAAALLSPLGLFAGVERAVTALGRWIGLALTWILLPAIFYAFFAPFGALFRRGHRDAMRRHFEPAAPSYWTQRDARSPHTASGSHERQY